MKNIFGKRNKGRERKPRVKDALERKPISTYDFVTKDNESDTIEVYIVRSIFGTSAVICSIKMTPEMDDVSVVEEAVPLGSLIYVGEPFVNVNGVLWNIRRNMMCTDRENENTYIVSISDLASSEE